MSDLVKSINNEVNNKLNNIEQKQDLNYLKFSKCMKLNEIISNGEIDNIQHDESLRVCMTKFPYDPKNNTMIGLNVENIITDKSTTSVKKNAIANEIAQEIMNKKDLNFDQKNTLINKKIAKLVHHQSIENMKEINPQNKDITMFDYIRDNISFLWFYVIEPNIMQIIIAVIVIVIVTSAQQNKL